MRCDYSFVCPIHQKEIEDERKLQQQEDWNEQVLHRLTEIELSLRVIATFLEPILAERKAEAIRRAVST